MTVLAFGSSHFDADMIAFDKDGTLTDFQHQWGQVAWTWLSSLSNEAGDGAAVREMAELLGYDLDRRRMRRDSPLASAPDEHLQAIVAAVLHRRGAAWSEALDRATESFQIVAGTEAVADIIRPLGDVRGLMETLHLRGLRLAVVTTDDRSRTQIALQVLGVSELINGLVCGDDGITWKPAPDMLLAVCEQTGLGPDRTAVVGDSVADMLMAQRAGAGMKVGVLTGTSARAELEASADVVLDSVEEIRVVD